LLRIFEIKIFLKTRDALEGKKHVRDSPVRYYFGKDYLWKEHKKRYGTWREDVERSKYSPDPNRALLDILAQEWAKPMSGYFFDARKSRCGPPGLPQSDDERSIREVIENEKKWDDINAHISKIFDRVDNMMDIMHIDRSSGVLRHQHFTIPICLQVPAHPRVGSLLLLIRFMALEWILIRSTYFRDAIVSSMIAMPFPELSIGYAFKLLVCMLFVAFCSGAFEDTRVVLDFLARLEFYFVVWTRVVLDFCGLGA